MQPSTIPLSKTVSKKGYSGNSLCNVAGCAAKVICRCTRCNNYYCYPHLRIDQHNIDNFEVLK